MELSRSVTAEEGGGKRPGRSLAVFPQERRIFANGVVTLCDNG